eukprot:TRINITY_DN67215_c0_g1_i1.p1 TRINITY_DN67215_c0_g1~~TRINITY_DN67215_c0_g1_i1.p1  ORF type:complete len:443 (-),score=78.45 TRINITY_DN67215_c0_g1_i1:116-1444(-)
MSRTNNTVFTEWAKQNAVPIVSVDPLEADDSDLKAIADSVGDAQIVALSEGCHNSRQMLSLHHRIAKYLIENCGFSIVVTENGLPESRQIGEYVQNKDFPNVEELYKTGLNKMYSEWKEGRDLIEWMRQYNKTHDNTLQYFGLDIGGCYQNWKRPMERILQYLESVDAEYAKQLREQLKPYLDIMTEKARVNYNEKLSPLEKALLAILLDEAVEKFNKHEKDYVSKSSQQDFEWARQSMISMQLAENYYRNALDRKTHPNSGKYQGLNGREIAMHRNLLWVLDTQKITRPDEKVKIIWINHVIHTKTETQYQDEIWGTFTPAGQFIRHSFRIDNVFIIGLIYGGGKYWKDWQKPETRTIAEIPAAKEDGIESIMSTVRHPDFYVQWDKISDLHQREGLEFMMSTFIMRENDEDDFIKLRPMEWNACIYLNEVDPATPVHDKN